jgi:hypothetical protein
MDFKDHWSAVCSKHLSAFWTKEMLRDVTIEFRTLHQVVVEATHQRRS